MMDGTGCVLAPARLRLVALVSVTVISIAACGGASTGSFAPHVGSAVDNARTSEPLSATTSSVVAAITTTSPPVSTTAPAIVTVPATTLPSVVTVAPDPHGVAFETGCVRPNIDFAAVRVAAGVTQPEVGRIPPTTCNVLVYDTGSDGRITWLEVGIGDVFGWSAQSNFVQTSFAPVPVVAPPGAAVATTLPPSVAPPSGGAVLDLQAQTVFGFHVGGVSIDQVINDVSAYLGPPTTDSGMHDTGEDCIGTARVVRWGDLSITFNKRSVSADPSVPSYDAILLWTLGDPGVLGAHSDGSNILGATGLHTAEGIGIGSTVESVTSAYGQQFPFFVQPDVHRQLAFGENAPIGDGGEMDVWLLAVNGQITGIASTLLFC
jgi:hypothetical protein